MSDLVELKSNYSFIDTPYDLLYSCSPGKDVNISSKIDASCTISRIVGITSAYVFPIFGSFGLVTNGIICYIFTFKYRKKSRQTVMLTFLAASDFAFILSFGWLWLFPAKGLPYASGGTKYLFIIYISDMGCRVFRSIYMTCGTWVLGAFLMVCFDRMLAIYFPMKMITFGYRSAIVSSFVMLGICIVVNNIYSGFIKWREISSKTYCILSTGDRHLLEFLNLWRVLCVFSGVIPITSVVFINIALIFKIVRNHAIIKKLTEGSMKKTKKEIKASMTMVTLSICFLIGNVPNMSLYLHTNHVENMDTNSLMVKDELQILYNLGDIGTHLLLLMESINIFIYYIKIKRFREEFNKIIGRRPETFNKIYAPKEDVQHS